MKKSELKKIIKEIILEQAGVGETLTDTTGCASGNPILGVALNVSVAGSNEYSTATLNAICSQACMEPSPFATAYSEEDATNACACCQASFNLETGANKPGAMPSPDTGGEDPRKKQNPIADPDGWFRDLDQTTKMRIIKQYTRK
tara:strand:- start:147 stop:581 length:435 start_codon:yes stop_codon:yes gene_type:complete